MTEPWKSIYDEFQLKLHWLKIQPMAFQRYLERCYFESENFWVVVKRKLLDFEFYCIEDEVAFFRDIKPRFNFEQEYCVLVYHTLFFKPEDGKGKEIKFWQRELERLDEFRSAHRSFYEYIKSGIHDRDTAYFTRSIETLPDSLGIRVYDGDTPGSYSSADHLLSRLMALERFEKYVHEKLGALHRAYPESKNRPY